MTMLRTLAAALAAAAIAAPAATARPADVAVSTPPAPRHQRQDLRGERAGDAAIRAGDAATIGARSAPFSGPASPGHPSEVAVTRPLPPVSDEPLPSRGDEVDWATLGLGIAGLVLFMGGVVALATRTRPAPGRRISV